VVKKKRKRKLTLYAVLEGEREESFFKFLQEIYYDKETLSIHPSPSYGGKPESLINQAISHADRDRCFVWLDEDQEFTDRDSLYKAWNISEGSRGEFMKEPLGLLQEKFNPDNKRKPSLIVSKPISVEAFILKVLGREIPLDCQILKPPERERQVRKLKNTLDGILENKDELRYYQDQLPKSVLEIRRKNISELDLLISMFECD
jgi:hypothetical protein